MTDSFNQGLASEGEIAGASGIDVQKAFVQTVVHTILAYGMKGS